MADCYLVHVFAIVLHISEYEQSWQLLLICSFKWCYIKRNWKKYDSVLKVEQNSLCSNVVLSYIWVIMLLWLINGVQKDRFFKMAWIEINMWSMCSCRVACYLHPLVCVVTIGGLSKLQWTGNTHETKHKWCNNNRHKWKSGAKTITVSNK